jgi:hypothetical protein
MSRQILKSGKQVQKRKLFPSTTARAFMW